VRKMNFKGISLKDSPSYQSNNLTYSPEADNIAYMRHTDVIVQHCTSSMNKKIATRAEADCVCTCKYVSVHDFDLLVVATPVGLQVWTSNAASIRFHAPIEDLIPAGLDESHREGAFLTGISAAESGFIYVGTSWGTILRLEVQGEDDDVLALAPLGAPTGSPVSATAASDNVVASGNERGGLTFYPGPSSSGDIEELFRVEEEGAAVTSMVCREWAVAAALSTGIINVYRADAQERILEIHGHARIIHSLYLRDSIMVSCGDDQVVCVWNFSPSGARCDTQVDFVENHHVPDRLLVGAVTTGSELMAVAYDDEHIYERKLTL